MDKFDLFLKEKGTNKAELLEKSGADISQAYTDFMVDFHEKIDNAKADKDLVIALQKEQSEYAVKHAEELNTVIKDLKMEIIQSKNDGKKNVVTFAENLKKGLEENAEKLAKIKTGETSEKIRIKAPADMTIATNVSGGNIPVEDRIEGLNIVPSREVRLLGIMTPFQTVSNVISWVFQANKDGVAGQTAEGTAKNKIDFDLQIASENVKKTTAYIKVSDEMVDDIPWMQSQINAELTRELLKAVEQGCYNGDGVNQNLNGIYTQASAFSAVAGLGANTVKDANIADVLVSAMTQIELAQEGGMPNYILMNPKDVNTLKTIKTTDSDYVDRLQIVGSSLSLDGVPVIKSTLVTGDEYLIGDFSKAVLATRSALDIEIGLDLDDFTKNMRTVRAEWRGACVVKSNDTSAFVKGNFTADKASLEVLP